MRMKFSATRPLPDIVRMGVDVDESRRKRQTARVEHVLRRGAIDFADRDDSPAPDRDVGTAAWRPGAVDDRRAGDHQVVLRCL